MRVSGGAGGTGKASEWILAAGIGNMEADAGDPERTGGFDSSIDGCC